MHSCITETILNNCHYSMTYIIYQYMFALRVCEQWQQENESIQQSESVQIKNPNPKKRWTVPSTKWSNGSTVCCRNHASDKHNLSDTWLNTLSNDTFRNSQLSSVNDVLVETITLSIFFASTIGQPPLAEATFRGLTTPHMDILSCG